MDYLTVDLEDLIDISGVHDLKPIYPRVIHTLPSQTKDLTWLDDEPIKVPSPSINDMLSISSSSSLPPLDTNPKKRKVSKTLTP